MNQLVLIAALAFQGGHVALTLTSPSFEHRAEIPTIFTCEGKDCSPALAWSGAPAGTKSFVLIADDPDAPDPAAPQRTWVHWVLYNLPVTAKGLAESVASNGLPGGTLEGLNDWGKSGYGGPCPPIGRHRYFFKLYALDLVLPAIDNPNKANVERAMKGHVVGKTELIGTYQKQG